MWHHQLWLLKYNMASPLIDQMVTCTGKYTAYRSFGAFYFGQKHTGLCWDHWPVTAHTCGAPSIFTKLQPRPFHVNDTWLLHFDPVKLGEGSVMTDSWALLAIREGGVSGQELDAGSALLMSSVLPVWMMSLAQDSSDHIKKVLATFFVLFFASGRN